MNSANIKEIMTGIGVFIVGCLIVIGGMRNTLSSTRAEEQIQLEGALKRAIVECYALEGVYPPNIEYIEQNYGIVIDREQFIVHYEAFADNIMPDFIVIAN
ncbi:MAG: hypothetical protein J6F30_04775 [Cellulosilyticum sp.]|nr:hypothetical protein [Cellulosilyticum sp.]